MRTALFYTCVRKGLTRRGGALAPRTRTGSTISSSITVGPEEGEDTGRTAVSMRHTTSKGTLGSHLVEVPVLRTAVVWHTTHVGRVGHLLLKMQDNTYA